MFLVKGAKKKDAEPAIAGWRVVLLLGPETFHRQPGL